MGGMQLRLVALVGILGLAAGWGLGDWNGAAREARNQEQRSAGPRPLGVESVPVAPRAQELRLRLQRPIEAPVPARNPFVFGGRTIRPSASRGASAGAPLDVSADAAPGSEPLPTIAAGPVLALSGIATERTGDAAVLTAMISDGQTLHFVKAGDALPGGYTVVAVDATQVTLRGAGGETILKLK